MAWKPDYVSLAAMREFATSSDIEADDTWIAKAITAASRSVDNTCNRQFGLVAAPEERFYTPSYSTSRGRWLIKVDDFQTATGMLVNLDLNEDGTFDDPVTGSIKLPRNAAAEGRPWEALLLPTTYSGRDGEVAATIRWGWTGIPVAVEEATLLQGSRFLARRHAPFGVAGSPEAGSELRLLAKVDPDVAVALRPYVRGKWSVG